MIRRPPRSTRTDTLFPYTTLFRSGVDNPLDLGFGTLVHHAPARAAVLAAVDALFRHHRIDGIGHGAVGSEGDDVTARQPPVDVAPALAGLDALQHTEPGTRHVALALFAGRDGDCGEAAADGQASGGDPPPGSDERSGGKRGG